MEHKKGNNWGLRSILYRKNPNLQLIGYVVSVLQNTIVVDITDIMGIEVDDARQVVKHGYYNKVDHRQIKIMFHKNAPRLI